MVILVTLLFFEIVRATTIAIAIRLILHKGSLDTAFSCSDVSFTFSQHAILELHIVEAVEEGEVTSREGGCVVGQIAAWRKVIVSNYLKKTEADQ